MQAEEQEGAHGRKLRGGGKDGRRDHYLSAPGRQAATFGGGGGAGGFELRYTKQKRQDDGREHEETTKNNNRIFTETSDEEHADCETCLALR